MELPLSIVQRRTALISAWLIGFFLAIWLFGFSIGGGVSTFLYLKFGAREKCLLSFLMALSAWAFTYGLFECLLNVPFPTGQLPLWLNLFPE